MSQNSSTPKPDLVAIGDLLGVVEEFIPGSGTYESNGKIYSSYVGYKRINRQRLEVSVDPIKKKEIITPQVGDTVICEVVITRKQSAMCHIFKIKSHFLFDTYTGMIHVSNMSQSYMNNVDDGFKPTDIVRAKVISKNFTEYELTTKYPELGVIYAECANCGTVLQREGNQLNCPLCGYPNPRKIAKDYGHVIERIDNLH
nr:exosome complex RNA-binding protein Csl4 [Candidatus Sigynarchaeota archaeon]